MKTTRSAKLRIEYMTRISDMWSMIATYKCTFAKYLEIRKERIEGTPEYAKLPIHSREYLRGYETAFYTLQTRQMMYVHSYAGKVYVKWDDLPEEGKQTFRDHTGKSAHVWPTGVRSGDSIESVKLWGEWAV